MRRQTTSETEADSLVRALRTDPALAEVAAAWERLPDNVRMTIVTLARTAPAAGYCPVLMSE